MRKYLLLVALSSSLAACASGGGSSSITPETPQPPQRETIREEIPEDYTILSEETRVRNGIWRNRDNVNNGPQLRQVRDVVTIVFQNIQWNSGGTMRQRRIELSRTTTTEYRTIANPAFTDTTDTASWSDWSRSTTNANGVETWTQTCEVTVNGVADSTAPTCEGDQPSEQRFAGVIEDRATGTTTSDPIPTASINTIDRDRQLPWINRAVANAWRDGWTGEGVEIAAVEPFQTNWNNRTSHISTVSSIIRGNCYNAESGIVVGYTNANCDNTANAFTPGIAPHATLRKWNTTDYARIDTDVNIINNSWGNGLYVGFNAGTTRPGTYAARRHDVWDAQRRHNAIRIISDRLQRNGALQVVAAGNDPMPCTNIYQCNVLAVEMTGNATLADTDNPDGTYTRDPNNVAIVVGAVNNTEDHARSLGAQQLTSYSTRAGMLKNDYIVTYGQGLTSRSQGTSYAAPRVSGAAALVIDKFQTNAANTKKIILGTADDLGAPGVDDIFGHGRLNVGRAMSPVGSLR